MSRVVNDAEHHKSIRIEELLPSLNKVNFQLPIVLGRTVEGSDFLFDLAKAPHVLIAGNPGSGKTMVLHAIICSLMIEKNPEDVQFILAQTDGYKDLYLYHLFTDYLKQPILFEVNEVLSMLEGVVLEIERRLDFFKETGARNITDYNKKRKERLPYIVIVIDGMSEVVKQDKKRFESLIRRITSVARLCGIHIVMTTNRISSDTISGTIMSNFPTTIALALSSRIQSRIVIGHNGAETLLGEGDMLYYKRNNHQPVRIQCVSCGPKDIE